ncbi:MAG: MYG1 family protein [Chlamydiae bacterium]|nr:MYG1 family protein [Chlamydiota bacterium]
MIHDKALGAVVHDGPFHADEIIACVQLVYAGLLQKEKICRTREIHKLQGHQFVIDVGGEYDPSQLRFDHHQSSYTGQMSSAGMVAQFLYRKGVYDDSLYHFLRKDLMDHVDAFDNGRVSREILNTPTFSHVIENFVPIQENASKKEMDHAFFLAFDFAYGHFDRLVKRYQFRQRCKQIIKQIMDSSKEILIFDDMMPWLENFFELGGQDHPGLYIVMPVPNGWKVRVIPKTYEDRMGARKDLPKSWGGLTDHELEAVTKIPGAKFCHKGLFIAVFATKEGAIEAAKKSLAYHERGL